uniref:Scaffold attachment factor B2-like n=1 Tax=Diabrotica virgifera virgifera TaxID=50390 RepID=A0A6P7FN31_DIAVI
MSSQHKKITELIVKELRNQLEERDMDTTGKKADLVERLKNALQEEGQDPETYLFEDKHAAVISSISKVSTDITSLENKVSTDITSLEHRVSNDILKVSGDISSLESKMTDKISKVTSDFDDKISSIKSTFEERSRK